MAKFRILVVDDEQDIRAILAATLRPHYEVVEAHDGLDALEKLNRTEPDFILMDVMMPLMDGFRTCEAIRKDIRFRDIPVMFLSALSTKDYIKKGYTSGANLYLTKPIEPARLLRNVQMFFETNPPSRRPKQFSINQLIQLEKSPPGPRPNIHDADTISDSDVTATEKMRTPPLRTPEPGGAVSSPPKANDLPSTADTIPQGASVQALPVRVMIVDDDEEIVQLISMILEGQFEITYSRDGLEAIDRIVRHQPDILIIDIMLPKMSGFQLCQSFRANRSFANTPILICSAKCSERDQAYAKRLGADAFLSKPFKSEQLLTLLREFTQLPTFSVRPKTLPIAEIQREIARTAESERVFEDDAELRRAESVPGSQPDTQKAVKQFLKQESGKDAFGHEDNADKEKKKKTHHLFGFGKKKE